MNEQLIRFGYQREAGQNAFTGICSFQHFNGEKLYSDCIVTSAGTLIETENYEAYPVPIGVAENGREEGYYPRNSIAYIRILWKELEPRQGEYDFSLIDEVIAEARKHNQTLMLRVMAHSTCERDDVPDWLKQIMFCPARPTGKRVKTSPLDVRFLEYFGGCIAELGKRYDDEPTLETVDISLPGAWGEGCNTNDYPRESVCKMLDCYLDNFKKTKLLGQMPYHWTMKYCLEHGSGNVGWRGDGAGEVSHMNDRYPFEIDKLPKDIWKTAPVSLESYFWLGEWYRQNWEIDRILQRFLDWHISSFNPKSLPIPFAWEEKIESWLARVGYHFVIDSIRIPREVERGERLEFELSIDNVGVAPIYHSLPLMVKLSGENGEKIYQTQVDIRTWLPGKSKECISLEMIEVLAGNYTLSVGIIAPEYPDVYFASNAPYSNGYYSLCMVDVK